MCLKHTIGYLAHSTILLHVQLQDIATLYVSWIQTPLYTLVVVTWWDDVILYWASLYSESPIYCFCTYMMYMKYLLTYIYMYIHTQRRTTEAEKLSHYYICVLTRACASLLEADTAQSGHHFAVAYISDRIRATGYATLSLLLCSIGSSPFPKMPELFRDLCFSQPCQNKF